MHYFVYLPLVHTFLAAQLATLRGHGRLRLAAFALVWLPSAALASIFFFEHAHVKQQFAQHGYLLWSNVGSLALAYGLLPAYASKQKSSGLVTEANAKT
jgi:hypothetical protein